MGTALAWDPWGELEERPHLTVIYAEISGADEIIRAAADGRRQVVLQRGLRRRRRTALLAHALVHDERGLFPPGTPKSLYSKEEAIVTDETALRLVPPAALVDYLAECEAADEPVHAFMVAERFDCDLKVAQRALSLTRVRPRIFRGP